MGGEGVRVTVDTNVLVRAAVQDEPLQSRVAVRLLQDAETVAVTLPTLCEFVWVLSRGYRHSTSSILSAIRRLLDSASVVADRAVIDHGVAAMAAGGDFADGVIAFDGRRLGGSVFASFDRHAVALIERNGGEVLLLPAMPS
jgi:predicted nucleic-acid-binding protein